eukprot:GHVP01023503.1.p1 GENE.GHVP01023503.1~~GHVP01023503.1.p1  ORF type:complete len:358 (+),score=71.43 GHVP01023503.1:213-1286(+)
MSIVEIHEELLRLVHCHNKEKLLEDHRVGALKLRDLRKVCFPALVEGQRASIEPRRNCILVNIPQFFRCIILHDRVLVMDLVKAEGPDLSHSPSISIQRHKKAKAFFNVNAEKHKITKASYSACVEKIQKLSTLKTSGPLEFAILEAILIEVCSGLVAEAVPILRDADRLVASFPQLSLRSSSVTIHMIHETRRQIDSLVDRGKSIVDSLREVQDEEETDMRRLEISRFWNFPDIWENPTPSSRIDDLEMLLECYEQEVESLLRLLHRVDAALDDGIQYLEIHLATVRNSFLKAEIGLDFVGVVMAFLGVLAGIFGMNLRNGFENSSRFFWSLFHGFVVSAFVAVAAVWVILRKLKI